MFSFDELIKFAECLEFDPEDAKAERGSAAREACGTSFPKSYSSSVLFSSADRKCVRRLIYSLQLELGQGFS